MTTTASCSALSTEDYGCLGSSATSSVVWRLRHFWTVMGLTPWPRASALTLASPRCWARRTAYVVVALPWRTWPMHSSCFAACRLGVPPHPGTEHLGGQVTRRRSAASCSYPIRRRAIIASRTADAIALKEASRSQRLSRAGLHRASNCRSCRKKRHASPTYAVATVPLCFVEGIICIDHELLEVRPSIN